MEIGFLLAGLAVGGVAVWLVLRARLASLQVALDHERRTGAEREASRADAETTLRGLLAQAVEQLRQANRQDVEQGRVAIEQLVAPVKQQIERLDGGVRKLETERAQADGAMREFLQNLAEGQERLRSETANLVTALRAPSVRGRWGEIQLRRVVEAAGMLPYCDFDEQASAVADGQTLRPDLVVRLPGAKQVVVDAKTPLAAYLEALEAQDDDVRVSRLRDHARQLRDHVAKLSSKAYWGQFESAPDFVVLFIPGDPFFAAALDQDPALQEDAWKRRVVLATPSTLIGLLFVVAYGWRQEKVAESARTVAELGKQLYERLATFADHFAKAGRGLDQAVSAYNQAVGSLERSVLPAARRFPDLGVPIAKQLAELEPIQHGTRSPQAPELLARTGGPALPTARQAEPEAGSDAADVPDAA
jgi:DNA recombination protein RmuC